MQNLILQPNATSSWHQIIKNAQENSEIELNEELESYLVFLLNRFSKDTSLLDSVLALDFLNSLEEKKSIQKEGLQTVGDKCLLLSGLFPARARTRRVKISYYVDLGRTAYSHLADINHQSVADLYNNLSYNFVNLLDVLYSVRQTNDIDLLEASELFSDVGSKYAKSFLDENTNGGILFHTTSPNSQKH